MIYLLLILLICLDIFVYILFDRNILSPSVIGITMFVVSTFLAVLYKNKWDYAFHISTVLIIITALMFLSAGELLVRLNLHRYSQFRYINYKENEAINISFIKILFILIIFSLLLIIYYKDTVRLACEAGYKKGQGVLMLAYARIGQLNEKGKFHPRSRFCNYTFTFIKCIAYVFTYIFLYNKIVCKQKHCFKYLLPFFLFIPYVVLTTGRTEFIYIAVLWIILGSCFFMQTKQWNPRYTFKIVKIALVGIFLFFVAFILAGMQRSSTLGEHVFDTIAAYAGGSIPSLDYYFNEYNSSPNEYFGQHTLFGIYDFVRIFDKSIPKFYKPYDFVYFNSFGGNVYSIIRRYHQDFGFFGLYFMMFFLGVFYSLFFLCVNNSRKNSKLLLYTMFFFPIVEMSIEERFFMNVISWGSINITIFLIIIFRLFVKSNKKWKQIIFTYKE